MKNYLIFHGHFYQPPREDPWTGRIPYQESAAPFHDWNDRINKECYSANAVSRVLDNQGRIIDIVNNYEYLSFNFGPTLIKWLHENDKETYQAIIDADKKSAEIHNGHGNGIAQSYNHTILPLCTPEDARTQIYWGIEDFKHHFNRMPEGMWLPEAGVNNTVIDILIDLGISFIILSPWQAHATHRRGSRSWQKLNGAPIDSTKPYKIVRPYGEMNVIFYNHQLASGISFEHYLKDSEELYRNLLRFYSTQNDYNLINIATDGEIYGHHEKYGDMCFSALTKLVEDRKQFQFTNYGCFLEKHPPEEQVKLANGEAGRGTSWSCSHGVSRWFKDCGCSTGGKEGWNQAWRPPLRKALDTLHTSCQRIFNTEIMKLSSKPPQQIRNSYIQAILDKNKIEFFIEENFDRADIENNQTIVRILQLMEGQKFLQFSYTSCGWFFSDISGIETIQNLHYAYRTIRLYSQFTAKDLLTPFMKTLEEAVSNLPSKGNGSAIMLEEVINKTKGPEYPAANLILQNLFDASTKGEAFGDFQALDFFQEQNGENSATSKGFIKLTDTNTRKEYQFNFKLEKKKSGEISLELYDSKKPDTPISIDFTLLSNASRLLIIQSVNREIEKHCLSSAETLIDDIRQGFLYSKRMHIQQTPNMSRMARLAVSKILNNIFLNAREQLDSKTMQQFAGIIEFIMEFDLQIEKEDIEELMSAYLARQAKQLNILDEDNSAKHILSILFLAKSGNLKPDVQRIQNMLFKAIHEKAANCLEEIQRENVNGLQTLKRFIKLGEALNMNVENLKEQLLEL